MYLHMLHHVSKLAGGILDAAEQRFVRHHALSGFAGSEGKCPDSSKSSFIPIAQSSRSAWIRWLPDIVLGGALALLAATLSLTLWGQVGDAIIDRQLQNFWFGADSPRVFENLTERLSDHYRTKVHPLFSLMVAMPTIGLIKVVGLTPVHAVLVGMASAAGGCPGRC
jgi:hypothetical protein